MGTASAAACRTNDLPLKLHFAQFKDPMRLEIDSTPAIIPSAEVHPNFPHSPADNAEQLVESGIRAAQRGDRVEARAALMRATEIDPASEKAWLWLASISEYPEELLVFLEHVLEINPENPRALEWRAATNTLLSKTFVQRGIDAADSGEKELAADHFTQALEYDSRNANAWMWMASLSESNEGKLLFIEKALSLEPDNADAQAALSAIRLEVTETHLSNAKAAAVAGRLDEANALLTAVIAVEPESKEAWTLRALFADSFAEKLHAFERLVEIDPENTAAVSNLEAMRSIAASVPQVPVPEQVSEDRDLDSASLAMAEVSRFDEEVATEKSPTQELELPDGVVEAFASDANDDSAVWDPTIEVHFPESEISAKEFSSDPWNEPDQNNVGESDGLGEPELDYQVVEAIPVEAEQFSGLQAAYENANGCELEAEAEPAATQEMESAEVPSSEFDPYTTVYSSSLLDVIVPDAEPAGSPAANDPASNDWENAYSDDISEANPYEQTPYFIPADDSEFEAGIPMPSGELAPYSAESSTDYSTRVVAPESPTRATTICPFCGSANEHLALMCQACMAVLTLSDIEMLLSNQHADRALLRSAVENLEGARNDHSLNETELTVLGIGHLNLRNFEAGYQYLTEAAALDPNNVIFASQINSLHLRLDEIRKQEEAHSTMSKGKTILVVDDSPTILKLIAGKLEKCGHDVFCSGNGEEAMERLQDLVPDLVLLDINMPKMDGYQVCKLIRARETTKDIPVVMISGKDGFFDKVRGKMAGTSGYITKPFGPETLMKVVESYLKGETPPAE